MGPPKPIFTRGLTLLALTVTAAPPFSRWRAKPEGQLDKAAG
jgi:hypothetical protein